MAKSSSSAVPGDVEWLPGPGGSRVLRIHPASPEPPALILHTAGGAEVRVEARPGPATEYDIPSELDWSTAWLQWPDGTRATVPAPHGPHAQVIELRPRRERAAGGDASTVGAIAAGSEAATETAARDEAPAAGATTTPRGTTSVGEAAARDETRPAATTTPRGTTSVGEAAARDETRPAATTTPRGTTSIGEAAARDETPAAAATTADTAAHWTTPPRGSAPAGADAEALWRSRTADLGRELVDAAAAIARAREGERSARDAVLTALAAARADLRASRAARAADASTLAAVTGELDAERSAHAVTRGSVGTLADALAAARTELAAARSTGDSALAGARAEAESLREALESERAARAATEALLRESVEARSVAEAALRENAEARSVAEAALRENAEARSVAEAALRENAEARSAAEAALREAEARSASEAVRREAEARTAAEAGADAAAADPADRVSLMDRVADLNRQAAGLRDQPALERRAREQAEAAAAVAPRAQEESAKLLANLDAAAAALRASAAPPVDEPPEREQAKSSTALVGPGEHARLRHALVAFAHEDPMAAGALLVGLLPAQGAVLEGSLSYDLTVRGVGTFAVTVEDGSARVVRLSRKRPRGEALFHLSGEPVALAELLAGERHKVGRLRRKARLTGNRKRGQELMALPEAPISLAQAARAGARLEPALVYRALPFAIDPEWTRGHNFTVAQQIVELAPQAWHITVRDGQPVRVVERNSGAQADATVTMSRAAFDRLLRAERPVHGDHPVVRGDREAVAALKRWTERLT